MVYVLPAYCTPLGEAKNNNECRKMDVCSVNMLPKNLKYSFVSKSFVEICAFFQRRDVTVSKTYKGFWKCHKKLVKNSYLSWFSFSTCVATSFSRWHEIAILALLKRTDAWRHAHCFGEQKSLTRAWRHRARRVARYGFSLLTRSARSPEYAKFWIFKIGLVLAEVRPIL